jgi:hypothetical protein
LTFSEHQRVLAGVLVSTNKELGFAMRQKNKISGNTMTTITAGNYFPVSPKLSRSQIKLPRRTIHAGFRHACASERSQIACQARSIFFWGQSSAPEPGAPGIRPRYPY